jgi:hypothetical protein
MAIGVACSRLGMVVPAGPVDTSEGGIRAAKNYVAAGELNTRPRL